MKRRSPSEEDANSVSSLLLVIHSTANSLLEQKLRNEPVDENASKHVLSALMALHSADAAREEEYEEALTASQQSGVDSMLKQLDDVVCHNQQLALLIETCEKAKTGGGSVEQLYQGLAEV